MKAIHTITHDGVQISGTLAELLAHIEEFFDCGRIEARKIYKSIAIR